MRAVKRENTVRICRKLCTVHRIRKTPSTGTWPGAVPQKPLRPVREGKPVRPERAGAAATAAAVFSVAQQRQAARGKLDADLVRAPRFEPDARKAQPVLFGKDFIVQPRLLHAAALPPDHVGLVFRPVVEQQILQRPGLFRRTSGQNGEIRLLHLSLSHRLRQPCGLLRRLCVDHHAADRLVEPVNGENVTAQLLGEQLGHRLRLRALRGYADGLDADKIARGFLQNFNHTLRLALGLFYQKNTHCATACNPRKLPV